MKSVLYARVSTDSQNYEGQITTLRAWGEGRGFEIREVYAEQESAWKEGHQKELARLIEDARKRKFDIVMVWALDRLSREGALSILTLVHTLHGYGVKILSYQESWTEAPGELAELLFALTGWVARMESARRSERTKLGIARKRRENGGGWGRKPGTTDKKKRKVRK